MIDWRHIARARAFTPGLAAETLERLGPLSAYAKQLGIAIEEGFGVGKIQLEIFEKTVEEKLRAPCFITAYPTEVSPFARRNELDRLPQLHPVGVHR